MSDGAGGSALRRRRPVIWIGLVVAVVGLVGLFVLLVPYQTEWKAIQRRTGDVGEGTTFWGIMGANAMHFVAQQMNIAQYGTVTAPDGFAVYRSQVVARFPWSVVDLEAGVQRHEPGESLRMAFRVLFMNYILEEPEREMQALNEAQFNDLYARRVQQWNAITDAESARAVAHEAERENRVLFGHPPRPVGPVGSDGAPTSAKGGTPPHLHQDYGRCALATAELDDLCRGMVFEWAYFTGHGKDRVALP